MMRGKRGTESCGWHEGARALLVFAFLAFWPVSAFARDSVRISPERTAAFVADFRARTIEEGLPPALFDAALKDFSPDPAVLKALEVQPEQTKTAPDYLALFLTPKRLQAAREALNRHHDLLADIESRFGVGRHILVAIWGIESSFGQVQGRFNVAHALATMLYAQKREKFARGQFFALLRLAQAEDITLPVKGSWASAMGPMQFIPATYESFAVDYDGDGRRDLFHHGDALASAAHYLARSGWQIWRRWGMEVILPGDFDHGRAGFDRAASFDRWAAAGVRMLNGATPAGHERAALFLPSGHRGPAFLVTGNFLALMEYNRSPLYALAASQIAVRLAGGDPIAAPWPGKKPRALDADERREFQARLQQAGFDPGPIDGIIGSQTRAALRDWQTAQNIPADGFVSPFMLRFLRVAPLPARGRGKSAS